MVSAKSLVLLFGAVAPAAVMAAPPVAVAADFAAAPPVVQAAPGMANVPNTVPKESALVRRGDGTHVQFWKEANFRGESISTNLNRGKNACYSFRGDRWGTWDRAIMSVNIVSGGWCKLYDGPSCNGNSIGPLKPNSPVQDLAVNGWARRAQSVSCTE
ncbi:hypothetical protein MAPG_02955 [Magnaporthiopsis poae ATCC 64411]|uniref:Beta/gamma crystallin 'Greek key' domain-containing protein n=1 Tax=Magnaporthiopsis poae (strain ATCC 64411 / 73-15) TaxID=644358 RepID=A0A0C4DSR7_MAGP6|nr:hypothetical protein MAPG_02955 [Magnaporthiopsis poae ATCC 64411]